MVLALKLCKSWAHASDGALMGWRMERRHRSLTCADSWGSGCWKCFLRCFSGRHPSAAACRSRYASERWSPWGSTSQIEPRTPQTHTDTYTGLSDALPYDRTPSACNTMPEHVWLQGLTGFPSRRCLTYWPASWGPWGLGSHRRAG